MSKVEVIAKPPAHLVGSRVPRDRGRAGRASLPGLQLPRLAIATVCEMAERSVRVGLCLRGGGNAQDEKLP